jgi:hypothetical protein
VEVYEHYIRLLEDGETCLYRVETSPDCTILIDSEKVDRIQIAAITPYIVTHRFYGRSVADLLVRDPEDLHHPHPGAPGQRLFRAEPPL